MYVANQHRLSENDALAYARKIGNGELISLFDGELQATHIPFIIVQDTAATSEAPATYHIETHLSQVNPQWRGTNEGPALLVVNIADQHVPGHLLPREQKFARLPQAPTWNYLTVHIRGHFTAIHDTDWKLAHLDRFVKHFEPEWRPATHSNYERLNHALPALIGIKMQVEQVIGKAKLHQQLASTEISLLAEKLHHIEKSNSIPQLMQDIAAPWAREREARVALARDKKTLPIIPAKNDSKNHK